MKCVRNCMLKVLFLMMLVFFLLPYKVEAKECKHKFDNDVCKKCGYFTVHEFEESITFFTVKEKVPMWSAPKKNSGLIEEIAEVDEMVEVDGLLRNRSGNIWLRVAGEEAYIYIENLYLDFSVLVVENYQKIIAWEDSEAQMVAFYDMVRPEGTADYKRWLDPSSKGIEYTVVIDDVCCRMTAEELGNIHYGFLGRAVGFNSETLLYAGGLLNQAGKLSVDKAIEYESEAEFYCRYLRGTSLMPFCVVTVATTDVISQIYEECSGAYCDTEEDATDVQNGINYYETGTFEQ